MSIFSRRRGSPRAVPTTAVRVERPTRDQPPDTVQDNAFTVPVGRGETRKGLNLRIVLPGVRRADLSFRIESGTLRLNGERHPPTGFAEGGRCHFAMPYGTFAQDVLLPDGLDVTRMQANLHEGVLDVHIPFAGEARPVVALEAGGILLDFSAAATR